MKLADYSTAQLLRELQRRQGVEAEEIEFEYCDGCNHYDHAKENVCAKNQSPTFRAPDDMGESMRNDWGWFKQDCLERE